MIKRQEQYNILVPSELKKCGSEKFKIRFRKLTEEKPTRCYSMVYCTYNLLDMFRALTRICPSSGARDYTCIITAYGV